MNVVHVTTVHSTFDTRIFHKEAKTLSEAGHEVILVAQHETTELRDGIRIEALPEVDNRVQRISNLPKAYRRAKQADADAYHFHDPELLPVAVALSFTTNAKIVYDIHEEYDHLIAYKDWIPDVVKPIVANSIVPIQSLCARRFDALVTANEWIAEDFERRGHDVTIVGNFPMTDEISFEDYSHEREHDFILTFVGNIDGGRGSMPILEVTKRLRERGYDVGAWLIGPIRNEELEQRIRDYIATNELDDAVRLFGYVDYTEMFSYLHAADAGMMLVDQGLYEHGLSNKMFEYMYAELPVVANSTVSTRKYVPSDCGIHVADGTDREEQANAIVELFEKSDEERQEMGKRGREHVLANCSWKNEAKKLVELYDSL